MTDDDDMIALGIESPITEERPWAVFAACKDKECLQFALETNARFGIWGGQTEKQRKALLRQIA